MPRWQSEHRPFKCEAPECAAARANPLYAAAAAMYKYDKRGGAPNKKRARASTHVAALSRAHCLMLL